MTCAGALALVLQITVEQPIEQGDIASARTIAIDRALQEMVKEAAARQSLVLPAAASQQARQFVTKYRIVDEQENASLLRLTLEGDVAMGRLVRAVGDRPPSPAIESPTFRLVDEGWLRGAQLAAARARAEGSEFDAWGFAENPAEARDAAREAAVRQQEARMPRRDVSLVISGIDSPVVLAKIREALAQRVAGVTSVMLQQAGRGRFEFAIECSRPPAALATSLADLALEDIRMELREIGPPIRISVESQ